MKSGQSLLLAVLALALLGGGIVAWRQHTELVGLRSAALDKTERADLQKRLWDLEKVNRELSDQLAAQRAGHRDGDGPPPLDDGGPPRGGRGANPNNPRELALRDLLARPEVQAMLAGQQKLQIEQRYAALFRNLSLTPEQADKLKTLLAERQNSAQEVLAVAREQGIDPRNDRVAFQKLLNDARDSVDQSIKGLVGEGGFAQLQTYERTLPQRALVDQLQQRLSYTPDPLTPTQGEQLVGILAANSPQPMGPPNPNRGLNLGRGGPADGAVMRGPDLGAMAGAVLGGAVGGVLEAGLRGPVVPVTPNAMNQAQAVLSQAQMTALQQIQQQQAQMQQVRQLVNDTIVGNGPARAGNPAPAPSNGGRKPGG